MECEGALWREQRRFALHTLRNFGFGKRSVEVAMNAELEHLVADIENLSGAGAGAGGGADAESKPIDPAFIMSQASANVIAMLVFGERLAAHEDFRRVNYCIHHCIASMELHPLARYLDKYVVSFSHLQCARRSVLCAHLRL